MSLRVAPRRSASTTGVERSVRSARLGHPRVGKLLNRVVEPPASEKAWAKGAEPERKVAAILDGLEGVVALHDRKVPGRVRANLDHVVVASSGVLVVDTKSYKGAIKVCRVGPPWRRTSQLRVARRDRTKLVDGVLTQVTAVRDLLVGAVTSDGETTTSPATSSTSAGMVQDRLVPVDAVLHNGSTHWPPSGHLARACVTGK